ncbi:MAG: XRE family transcriptional regulator [Bacteroidetes bacterium]|nr:XRE family transcriptional regulator [Bacteroidota bacterium]
MATRAYITPNVLKWARESARMTEEIAASKVSVSVDKLVEWEKGDKQPTIRQAQILAKAYKRPFSILFLPEIPRDFQPLQDFRKNGSKSLSTSSIFIIREIQQKQSWISETNREGGENKLPFVGRYSLMDNPKVIANDILQTLGIIAGNYKSNNPMKEWIAKAEAKGIFISRTSFIHSRLRLDSGELQGFAIADPYAPFVFINSDDWGTAQLFTLVHELAHIWIAETGISNSTELDIKTASDFNKVELFCNEIAANVLIPETIIENFDRSAFKDSKRLFSAARSIGVSSFSFLVRALNLNIITLPVYSRLKAEAELDFEEHLRNEAEKKAKQKANENSGGPDYFLLQLNRNSRLFTQTVLDSFRGGIIEPTLASKLLNVQINKFPKLEAQLYK